MSECPGGTWGVFGLSETVVFGSMAAGSIVASGLIAPVGVRWSLAVVGCILPVVAAACERSKPYALASEDVLTAVSRYEQCKRLAHEGVDERLRGHDGSADRGRDASADRGRDQSDRAEGNR